ncbi:hypothetical protein COCSUDRAFT_34249 [Coccomyxa subellipsoidea C-169]|uniref:Uncharacterized protein n=1 Tax=Coccomyxa subellipsoidea (strain C-169) TaxID=574566 RepID=I0YLI6_COCSC|nr:hypothetical protein COCSUDRAFT_34249 [Coccomyxa subellipsoidea C-169]EIE19255.1 hypothetical protein COCSUDRAFT_34249 [Coccomyxa subellipsoidea C-169]|eukprot:XP_005643799.1 hypothetical protein COCSUDRAFT_34249 [Coccomyxa subellipsoidea C-169]
MQSAGLARTRVVAPRASALQARPVARVPPAQRSALRAQPKEAVETVTQDDKDKDADTEEQKQPQKLEEVVYTDPLELYCDDNPEADECRVYED